jgi:flagellar basal-body rod protein FlgB
MFDTTFDVLAKALDLRMVANRLVASNLANVDTPGFQAHRLDFEASMQQAIDQIDQAGASVDPLDPAAQTRHALGADPSVEPIIQPTNDPALSLDGNNVNMEAELGELGRNNLMYQLTAQLMAAKIRGLELVLQDEGA